MSKKQAMGSDPLGFIKNTSDSKAKKGTLLNVPSKSGSSAKSSRAKKVKSVPAETLIAAQEKGSPLMSSLRSKSDQGWIRATYIVREEFSKEIKDIAYWERRPIKDVLDEALASYLSSKKVQKSA